VADIWLLQVREQLLPNSASSPNLPSPPSVKVQQARQRCDGYLERLRKRPFNTQVLTDQIRQIDRRCDITILSNFDTSSDIENNMQTFNDLETLRTALEEWLDQPSRNEAGMVLLVEDPPPNLVRMLGGYLDIPTDFFASHAADGGVYMDVYSGEDPVRSPKF
jgi:hypothetical protein